jgi:hypothetical protein
MFTTNVISKQEIITIVAVLKLKKTKQSYIFILKLEMLLDAFIYFTCKKM